MSYTIKKIYYTTHELAEALGIPYHDVMTMIHEKHIKAIKGRGKYGLYKIYYTTFDKLTKKKS